MIRFLLPRFEEMVADAQGRRLPSVRALAARWQVSPNTAHAVVKAAVNQGLVETRPGGGIWPKGRLPAPQKSRKRPYADEIAGEIRDALRSGKWAAGERLPTPKDLASRYRVHVITLRRALRILESETLLERQGQTWRVARPRFRKSVRPLLLCLGAVDHEGRLRVDSDREWEFWREIQAEATRHGLRTEIRPWNISLNPKTRSDAKPIGAVVSTWHIGDPLPLLKSLHRLHLASAIWLENPLIRPGLLPFASPLLGYHDLAYSDESGALLAKHALLKQYQSLVWLSPFHGAEWSRNRLAGLKAHLPRTTLVHEALGPWVSEWDLAGLSGDKGRQRIFKQFEKQLQQALEVRASLWVAASDSVALHCLHWLRKQGVQVPRDLGLVGFDDSREALRNGLTSVRFDVEAMARAMVRQVLMPGVSRKRLTRYEGMVIVRDSTS